MQEHIWLNTELFEYYGRYGMINNLITSIYFIINLL